MLLVPVGARETKPGWRTITLAIAAACVVVQLLSSLLKPADEELFAAEIAVERASVAILVGHGLLRSEHGALFGLSERERHFVRHYPGNPDAKPTLLEAYRSARENLRRLSARDPAARLAWTSDALLSPNLLLSAFAHGDWVHLLTNLLALVIFGSLMELRWGRRAYLLLYCGGALAAGAAFLLVHREREFVLLGASGAVAATMGAMFVSCYGRDTRYWYAVPRRGGWRSGTFSFPSLFILPIWIAEQLGFMQLEAMGFSSGVAFSGHVGGFAFGALLALALRQTGLEERLLPASELIGNSPATEEHEFLAPATTADEPDPFSGQAQRRLAAPRE